MYPSTGVSAPWPRCRAQLEMQVRRCTRRQARQVRQAHTQRSRTHTSPQEQGSCPDRDVTAASILLFPIVDLCFGRHPDQTHTWNDWACTSSTTWQQCSST